MSRTWLICLLYFFPGCAVAGDLIPLPFEGNYESRGSVAREQATPEQWRDIPQEVRMRLIRDEEIIELQLEIDVQLTGGNDAPSVHTIFNRMWLVGRSRQAGAGASGRAVFDVYKFIPETSRFDDLGDGYCSVTECSFSYVTVKAGKPQRYHSNVYWEAGQAGETFRQSGGLSLKEAEGLDWVVFKSWENIFSRVPPER
jgi:hypothetical protein